MVYQKLDIVVPSGLVFICSQKLTVIVRAPGYLYRLLDLGLLLDDGLLLAGGLGLLDLLRRLGVQGGEAPARAQTYIVTGKVFRAGGHLVNWRKIYALKVRKGFSCTEILVIIEMIKLSFIMRVNTIVL